MSSRATVIRASTLLMEAMWTYAVVAFAVALFAEGGKPSFLGVCAVVFFSFAISRGLQATDISLGVLKAWGTMLSLLLFYAIVRVDFFDNWRFWDFGWANGLFNDTANTIDAQLSAAFGVPILAFFWARGINRGQSPLQFENVISSFGIGILIIAFIELFQGQVQDSPGTVGRIAVPYVAFGLFAIGLAHSARAQTGQGRPFSRSLLTAIGVSIAALAVAAAIVGLFDLVTSYDAARSTGSWLADTGGAVANVVLWPLEKLADGIFSVLVWLRDLILGKPQPPVADQNTGEGTTCIQAFMEQGKTLQEATDKCTPQPHSLPEWVRTLIRFIVAVPFMGIGLLLISQIFGRFRKRRPAGELKESSYQQGRLGTDLSNLLQNLMGRLRPNIHIGGEHLDAARRLYYEVVDDGERHGVNRKPHETPNEFAPALDQTFRGAVPTRITTAFDDARYGAHPPPDAEVKRLRAEWERLRQEQ